MANLITGSQSSLLLPQLHPHANLAGRGPLSISYGGVSISSCCRPVGSSRTKSENSLILPMSAVSHHNRCLQKGFGASLISRASSLDIEVPGEAVDVKPDSTGGGGDEGSGKDRNGGSGGGGGGDSGENKGDEGSDESNAKRGKALLMSQKFTLAYAALVGLGGLVGYLKSGSQKSLASGGLSALLLYYVYTELPKRPVFASAVGLGLSAALLVVMGSRFKKSGKVFPAGVVSLVSLIMTGGYIHGIMKTH